MRFKIPSDRREARLILDELTASLVSVSWFIYAVRQLYSILTGD